MELNGDRVAVDFDGGDAPRGLMAGSSAVAGIEEQASGDHFMALPVGMPEDHDFRRIMEVGLLQAIGWGLGINDVVDEKAASTQFDFLQVAQLKPRVVGVTQDGGDRGDRLQIHDQAWKADVASMKDMVSPLKKGEDRGV